MPLYKHEFKTTRRESRRAASESGDVGGHTARGDIQ